MALHDERLRLPLWWWLAGLGTGGLLAAEIHLAYPGLRSWVLYPVVLLLVGAVLWRLGRIRVRIEGEELHVDDAHVPLRLVADAEPLSGEAKRAALGPDLHALAFVIVRPWVPGAVLLTLDDPGDPTPYWIISSRYPERLASALRGSAKAAWPDG